MDKSNITFRGNSWRLITNRLKPEKQALVLPMLVESNSIRSTERITGVHRDTIVSLTVRNSQQCGRFMQETVRNLECRRLELDEIWAFCRKKQLRLTKREKRIRSIMRRFTRLSLGFFKKLENLKVAVALHFACYNFCWIPRTTGVTPATRAGIAGGAWSIEHLINQVYVTGGSLAA